MDITPTPDVIYRADGDSIDYTPAADTQPGTVVAFGGGIAITKSFIPASHLGTLHRAGQWDFPKDSAADFAYGAALEWDAGAKEMKASGGTTVNAYCSAPDGAAAGTSMVRAVLV